MRLFLLATMVSCVSSLAVAKQCPAEEIQWQKCRGDVVKSDEGKNLEINSKPQGKECYEWSGKARVTCSKGTWVVDSKVSKCNWECTCCY